MPNSQVNTGLNTENQLNSNYDHSIIFLGCNNFEDGVYTNSTGAEVTLEAGTLMGRISANQELTPLKSAAADGSQFPVGVLTEKTVVPDGVTANISICVGGDVEGNRIVFDGTDDFDTVVSGRNLRDRISGDTLGIKLFFSTENTNYDNQ